MPAVVPNKPPWTPPEFTLRRRGLARLRVEPPPGGGDGAYSCTPPPTRRRWGRGDRRRSAEVGGQWSVARGWIDHVRSETLMETLEGALLGASGPLQVRPFGEDVCAGRFCAPARPPTACDRARALPTPSLWPCPGRSRVAASVTPCPEHKPFLHPVRGSL